MKNQIFTELCVKEIDKNIDFFTTILGFSLLKKEANFAELNYGDSRMLLNVKENYLEGHHFFNRIDQANNGYGIEIGIQVSNLGDVYEKGKGHPAIRSMTEIKEQNWDSKDFRIVTVDNYYLRITQKHED